MHCRIGTLVCVVVVGLGGLGTHCGCDGDDTKYCALLLRKVMPVEYDARAPVGMSSLFQAKLGLYGGRRPYPFALSRPVSVPVCVVVIHEVQLRIALCSISEYYSVFKGTYCKSSPFLLPCHATPRHATPRIPCQAGLAPRPKLKACEQSVSTFERTFRSTEYAIEPPKKKTSHRDHAPSILHLRNVSGQDHRKKKQGVRS